MCRQNPTSTGFKLRYRIVQKTLGLLKRQANILHIVEPPHFRPFRNEGPYSGRGSGLIKLAHILLYALCIDHHGCVDLVGVSPEMAVGGELP